MKFRKILEFIENYWETKSNWIYLSYISISYNFLGECRDKAIQSIIYVDIYKVEDHILRISSCIIKMGKICIYNISKYVNCRISY